ncbi:MAG: glycoside hydrolase family 172 protein [Candidatus Helarchaeota archaeon]
MNPSFNSLFSYSTIPNLNIPKTHMISTRFVKDDGKYQDWIKMGPGESYEFKEIEGPGVVRVIWVTIAPSMYNLMKVMSYKDLRILKRIGIKIRYDGEEKSSIKVPIGNFFGSTFGRYKHYCSKYMGTTSGGYHSLFPMPFKKGFKLIIKNYSSNQSIKFYGYIEYQKLSSFPENVGYFYASYEQARPPVGKPFRILDVEGKGLFVGTNIGMRGSNTNIPLFFLEGNVEICVDETPCFQYTGTEDYFLSGWYFVTGEFCDELHGCTIKSWKHGGIISAYRFHRPPIAFDKKFKIVVHHGEYDQVRCNYESTAYFYLERK